MFENRAPRRISELKRKEISGSRENGKPHILESLLNIIRVIK
jgi:hypothetical protein